MCIFFMNSSFARTIIACTLNNFLKICRDKLIKKELCGLKGVITTFLDFFFGEKILKSLLKKTCYISIKNRMKKIVEHPPFTQYNLRH